jgi:hypothetical protein
MQSNAMVEQPAHRFAKDGVKPDAFEHILKDLFFFFGAEVCAEHRASELCGFALTKMDNVHGRFVVTD